MFDNIFLALVQGLTEFLPVSSSGHIVIAQEFLSREYDLFIIIWLHAASLLAVLVYYRKDIWTLVRDFFLFVRRQESQDGLLAFKLGIATLITAAIGFFFAQYITNSLSLVLVGSMLIITGLMIYIAERLRVRVGDQDFGWLHVIGVGISQGLAVIPGLSRSGTTIAYLVAAGIERTDAVRLSFLLSIPAITGSLIFAFSDQEYVTRALSMEYIIVFAVGFVTSLASIKFMTILVKEAWVWFIPYCIVLGATVLLFL